jgi:hypothetical protein
MSLHGQQQTDQGARVYVLHVGRPRAQKVLWGHSACLCCGLGGYYVHAALHVGRVAVSGVDAQLGIKVGCAGAVKGDIASRRTISTMCQAMGTS